MSKPIDQEREAFEAAFAGKANFERNQFHPEHYAHLPARQMWDAWQARAQLQPAGVAVPGFAAGVKAASDHVKAMVEEYDRRHGSTDPDTGTREYPGNGDEWVGQMMELIEDFTGIVAPHPVSGEFNPEHTLFNEIRTSMPINEDDEPARYIITEDQLQRIRALEFSRHTVSGEQKGECEWCAGAGHDYYGKSCQHCKAPYAIDITDRIPAPYTVGRCPLCGCDINTDAPVTLVEALERQGLAHTACVKGSQP